MKKTLAALFFLSTLVAICIGLVGQEFLRSDAEPQLLVHCAAGLQKPLRGIADLYQKKSGTKISLNFGGAGALESQLRVAGGDLFIPADDSYLDRTQAEGLVSESETLALLRAVIVVPKGNPKGIGSLDDLAKKGVRLSVAEPSAAVGRFVRVVLGESGDWEKIAPRIVVTKPTVNNVVQDVATGAVDAGLAWGAVAAQFPEVETVAVPVLQKNRAKQRRASFEARIDRARRIFCVFSFPHKAEKFLQKWDSRCLLKSH